MKLHVDSNFYYLKIEQSDTTLPYLLMFHGFMGTGSSFSHLIEPLSTFCNPITIDLLGHGRSSMCIDPNGYDSTVQVAHVRSILRRLKIENLYIYGYSMGGRLVFQLLSQAEDFCNGAIVESSHCGLPDEMDRQERKKNDDILAGKIEEDFKSFIYQWSRLPLFASTPDPFAQDYENRMITQDHRSMAASLRGFGSGVMPPVCNGLKKIKTPIHLIAGENDLKYSLLMGQISELNSNFTFEPVSNAGHRVHTDQPKHLIQSIHDFLRMQNS